MEHPVTSLNLTGQVAKICSPKAPTPLKMMAADGLAPLPPLDLLTTLYVLGYGPDEKVAKKACTTVSKLPESILFGVLDQLSNDGVIDGIARMLEKRIDALEHVVLNQASSGETVVWIAKEAGDEKLLEIIGSNEQRMLSTPAIIEALYNNKSARMSTVDRAVELAVRNGVELKGIASYDQIKAAIDGQLVTEAADEPTPEDVLFRDTLEDEKWDEFNEKEVASLMAASAEEIERDEDKKKAKEVVEAVETRLSEMSISAKIRVATLGSSTQRSVLIRDTNKLVLMAVVQSPLLSESEIGQYSRFRSLPEEAMRYMASNRDWTKHYQVKLNLVQNPRTPLEYSMRFIPHLRTPDVRALERDKTVPQAIARAAKQLRTKRAK